MRPALLSILALFVSSAALAGGPARTLLCLSPGSAVARQDLVSLGEDASATVEIGLRAFNEEGGFFPVCRSLQATYAEDSTILRVTGFLDCGAEGRGPYELELDLARMRTKQGHACEWE